MDKWTSVGCSIKVTFSPIFEWFQADLLIWFLDFFVDCESFLLSKAGVLLSNSDCSSFGTQKALWKKRNTLNQFHKINGRRLGNTFEKFFFYLKGMFLFILNRIAIIPAYVWQMKFADFTIHIMKSGNWSIFSFSLQLRNVKICSYAQMMLSLCVLQSL